MPHHKLPVLIASATVLLLLAGLGLAGCAASNTAGERASGALDQVAAPGQRAAARTWIELPADELARVKNPHNHRGQLACGICHEPHDIKAHEDGLRYKTLDLCSKCHADPDGDTFKTSGLMP